MSETRHTPGPWHLPREDSLHWRGQVPVTAPCDISGPFAGARVATVNGPVGAPGVATEQHANARLIASAPAMYEALRFYADELNWRKSLGMEHDKGAVARAALVEVDTTGQAQDKAWDSHWAKQDDARGES